MPERRPIAVLGPGGVGGLLAAVLARSGEPVIVLAGDSTAEAIARRGLRVESPMFGPFEVSVKTATVLDEPVDACLVTVKATQLDDAVRRVPAGAVDGGLVIPFLNGIDHVERLRERYPDGGVAPATIRIEVMRLEPGFVRHTTAFASIDIAASETTRQRVEAVAARLRAAGLEVRLREDEIPMLWDKLAFLAPLALLTTHERANVGVVRTRRHDELVAMIGEVVDVANGEGADIDAKRVAQAFDRMPEAMSSSMQRDDAAGLPIELDAIGGAVLRHAARAGIRTPVTEKIFRDLAERS